MELTLLTFLPVIGIPFLFLSNSVKVQRMIALACQYGRYGYRRITVLLRREGWQVNRKRIERLWRQAGLKVHHPYRGSHHCQYSSHNADRAQGRLPGHRYRGSTSDLRTPRSLQ